MCCDHRDVHFTTDQRPPIELIEVAETKSGPPELRHLIVVDTVHDGAAIPRRLLESPRVAPLVADGTLWRHYVRERDWGANMVAEHLAHLLGLGGYYRVNTARVVTDFNRLPGSSPPGTKSFDRLAISEPLSMYLNHQEKRYVLEQYYDAISDGMERALAGKMIKIAIHTYDEHNPTATRRPDVSLVTRSQSYQLSSRLPYGLFDPLFPDVLVESSCDTILRDRIGLTLEKAGINVEHNYPYLLPDGSIEMRCQPWLFFRHVKQQFERRRPESRSSAAFGLVWEMLFNTNLRRGDGEALYGYLHRFRPAPVGREEEFAAALAAYQTISTFVEETRDRLLEQYRQPGVRVSALGVEIRKNIVWEFDGNEPVVPNEDNARSIASKLAEAVVTYVREDRPPLGNGGVAAGCG